MSIDNLCNEGQHRSLHQLGDRLRKALRAVGAKSGADIIILLLSFSYLPPIRGPSIAIMLLY